jgi:type IV pilus assembly protein PilN
MIRINLIPFRVARKRENIRRQTSIYFLSVIFLLTLMGYYFLSLNGELRTLKAQEALKRQEADSYAETLKKIEELKKKIKEIQPKLEVIQELEKQKMGPVRLLDEITTAVPRDRLWLTSLKESSGTLNLTGTARDKDTVAIFMKNLEKAKQITFVNLKSTRLRKLPQYKIDVDDFVLTCGTSLQKEKPQEKPQKRRRAKRG